jgi:predicted nuclease of restriction endonuclease-like RecB superfamily
MRYKVKRDCIHPEFIPAKSPEALAVAQAMLDVCQKSQGLKRAGLEDRLDLSTLGYDQPFVAGLRKIVIDRCEFPDSSDPKYHETRAQWLALAQKLRETRYFPSLEAFYESFAAEAQVPVEEAKQQLYADLPEHQKLTGFEACPPETLLKRYNIALVQGLLLQSRSIEIALTTPSVLNLRHLLRSIKFHRLLVARMEKEEQILRFHLEGPLALFESNRMYGSRVANFFPNLLRQERWSLRAVVELKRKGLVLHLDEASGLKPLQRETNDGHIPEEFSHFLKEFNMMSSTWQGHINDEIVSLGAQDFCVPDFYFEHAGQKVYLELFHRWHQGTFVKRVKTLHSLTKNHQRKIILGVCQSILRKDAIESLLSEKGGIAAFGFKFRDFPTPRTLLTALEDGRDADL